MITEDGGRLEYIGFKLLPPILKGSARGRRLSRREKYRLMEALSARHPDRRNIMRQFNITERTFYLYRSKARGFEP